jgi:large subunit ribosomal protein L29
MKAGELRPLSDAELADNINDAKEEMFKLRFQIASGQLEEFSRIKVVRRNIARLKTIQRERQIAEMLARETHNG